MFNKAGSQKLAECSLFSLRQDHLLNERGEESFYWVMESRDWANGVAITRNREIILVRQYRYAGEGSFLEIPGGVCEPKESPEDAFARELIEETGFCSERIKKLASHYPNPALLNNRMHTFIAWDCEYKKVPILEPFESLETVLMPLGKLFQAIEEGQIRHSIVLASLFLAMPELRKASNSP